MESLHVMIVGAGCFGVSAAVHLLQENGSGGPIYSVTIIDSSDAIPAPDAASTDLNKIVRSSLYPDPFYTSFARVAMREWTSLGDAYHESGVLVLHGTTPYGAAAMNNDINNGTDILLGVDPLVRSRFPEDATVASTIQRAHFYQDGGWANATAAMVHMVARAKELGAIFLTGHALDDLVFETGVAKKGQRVVGIKTMSGKVLDADIVILAMGAWTASSLSARPELGIADKVIASGQCLVYIQLDEKLAAKYSATPVILELGGFYILPPTHDNIIKVGMHGQGYTYHASSISVPSATNIATSMEDKVSTLSSISTPRTVRTHGERGLDIPSEMAQLLRVKLRTVYPELADLPFKSTRMCWYADTPDEDWIIDEHPDHPKLYFATGGSGHAFKFLPIIGSLVVQRLKNTLPPDVAAKFSFSRTAVDSHGYRTGVTKVLNNMAFASEADLSNTEVDPMPEVRV